MFNVIKSNVKVIGKDDELLLPDITFGGGILSWVKEIKYLGVFLKSKKGLKINIALNCRNFLGASFAELQMCGSLSEPVLREIVLPILMYGVEYFFFVS